MTTLIHTESGPVTQVHKRRGILEPRGIHPVQGDRRVSRVGSILNACVVRDKLASSMAGIAQAGIAYAGVERRQVWLTAASVGPCMGRTRRHLRPGGCVLGSTSRCGWGMVVTHSELRVPLRATLRHRHDLRARRAVW